MTWLMIFFLLVTFLTLLIQKSQYFLCQLPHFIAIFIYTLKNYANQRQVITYIINYRLNRKSEYFHHTIDVVHPSHLFFSEWCKNDRDKVFEFTDNWLSTLKAPVYNKPSQAILHLASHNGQSIIYFYIVINGLRAISQWRRHAQ